MQQLHEDCHNFISAANYNQDFLQNDFMSDIT